MFKKALVAAFVLVSGCVSAYASLPDVKCLGSFDEVKEIYVLPAIYNNAKWSKHVAGHEGKVCWFLVANNGKIKKNPPKAHMAKYKNHLSDERRIQIINTYFALYGDNWSKWPANTYASMMQELDR